MVWTVHFRMVAPLLHAIAVEEPSRMSFRTIYLFTRHFMNLSLSAIFAAMGKIETDDLISHQASNMNFALHISCMVEEKLALITRSLDWTQVDEAQAYEGCLIDALEDNGRAWAGGNIRVGDYILLSKSLILWFFSLSGS